MSGPRKRSLLVVTDALTVPLQTIEFFSGVIFRLIYGCKLEEKLQYARQCECKVLCGTRTSESRRAIQTLKHRDDTTWRHSQNSMQWEPVCMVQTQ
jgi:hypothetical protein